MEQLLWRHITKPLVIVYTPLITDWSGSKISKSLYLRGGAYDMEAGRIIFSHGTNSNMMNPESAFSGRRLDDG